MDQLPTDDMRKHIAIMSKRSFYNEDDKLCFLQLTMLLNSLEALSQDQCLLGDEFSSMDYSMVISPVKFKKNYKRNNLPFLLSGQIQVPKNARYATTNDKSI